MTDWFHVRGTRTVVTARAVINDTRVIEHGRLKRTTCYMTDITILRCAADDRYGQMWRCGIIGRASGIRTVMAGVTAFA